VATIEKRISNDGEVVYRVKVRLRGHPEQNATFARKTDAKNWAQNTESSIRDGRHFKTVEAKRHTLSELIDRYIRDVLPTKPKSQKKQQAQLLWWKKAIGSYSLADIRPALIAEQRDALLREQTARKKLRSPSTVVRYLAALSHAFSIAIKEFGWVEINPVLRISKPKEPRGRVRFLSDDERTRLLKAAKESASPHLYLIIVLCLSTGARKMEIVGLKWHAVDLQRGIIILHETKNNERRVLPITGHALALMNEHSKLRFLDSDFVFPSPNDHKRPIDIQTAWKRILAKAEISNFRFHDLRHSAASYLAMNGASLAEIAEVLGHKTLQMVKRYAHLSDAHTATVVARMNEKIFGG
jgi:hypothetical protein